MWIKTNKQTTEYQPAPAFGIGYFSLAYPNDQMKKHMKKDSLKTCCINVSQ